MEQKNLLAIAGELIDQYQKQLDYLRSIEPKNGNDEMRKILKEGNIMGIISGIKELLYKGELK